MRGDVDDLPAQVFINTGKLGEMDKRLEAISNRLDTHLAACTARFIGLITMILVVAGILAALIEHARHG